MLPPFTHGTQGVVSQSVIEMMFSGGATLDWIGGVVPPAVLVRERVGRSAPATAGSEKTATKRVTNRRLARVRVLRILRPMCSDIHTMPGSQSFASDPRNEGVWVSLNGQLVTRQAAKVSIFDGGFVVGDGVWEGIRLHKDALLFLNDHIKRLYHGARKIRLDIGIEPNALIAEIRRTLDANSMHDGVHIRIMITRGEKSALNQDPRNALGRPTIAIVAEFKVPDPGLVTQGLTLKTVSIRCTPAHMFDMRLNSHSRLSLILALLEAIEAGADEALMLDPQGMVSSCNATNFFCVKNEEVFTSSGEYCFNGVTRANVIWLCRHNGIPIRVGDVTMDEVRAAQEAFVTGTFGGLTPVRQIDANLLAGPIPGPVTQRLRALYESLKHAQAPVGHRP
jgi:branched-chain amino acid aminotransferase